MVRMRGRVRLHVYFRCRNRCLGIGSRRPFEESRDMIFEARSMRIYLLGERERARATGLNFLAFPTTLRMRALRANVKPAHCKFKGRTFSATASSSANACLLSTTDHPCAWTVSTPAEPISVWTSPHETTTTLCVFYSQSYAIRPCCPPVNSLLSAVFDLLP